MNTVLRGIALSTHAPALKRTLIEKILTSFASPPPSSSAPSSTPSSATPLPLENILVLFHIAQEWILSPPSPATTSEALSRELGLRILIHLCTVYPALCTTLLHSSRLLSSLSGTTATATAPSSSSSSSSSPAALSRYLENPALRILLLLILHVKFPLVLPMTHPALLDPTPSPSPRAADHTFLSRFASVVSSDIAAAHMVGLANLGNTCYLNSVTRALFMTKKFRLALLALPSPSPLKASCLLATQELFAHLALSVRPYTQPAGFVATCIPPWFTPGDQQDSSEFLRYLLDQLESQVKQQSSSSSSPATTPGTDIFPANIFGGMLVNRIRCLRCQSARDVLETFNDLSLAFPQHVASSPELSVSELLQFFMKTESLSLSESNAYHCAVCQCLVDAEKSVRIKTSPEHLVISLKRFSVEKIPRRAAPAQNSATGHDYIRKKILTPVRFPLHLSLAPALFRFDDASSSEPVPLGGMEYQLYAIVTHSGVSSDRGHYYCHGMVHHDADSDSEASLEQEGSTYAWFEFNDSTVRPSSWEDIVSVTKRHPTDTPYQLFYRRRSQPHKSERGGAQTFPPALVKSVMLDNFKFLRELEDDSHSKQAPAPQKQKQPASTAQTAPSHRWNYDSDDDEESSHSSAQNDLFGGNRFIF